MSTKSPPPEIEGLLDLLAVPRPNGSRALRETAARLVRILRGYGIPCRIEPYPLGAYFNEILGAWLILSGLALLIAAALREGWFALGIAILAVLVPFLEIGRMIPVITRLVRVRGENLVCELPAPEPAQEILVAAHYDSKTELLDSVRRQWLLGHVRPAMGLALVAGLAGAAAELVGSFGGPGSALLFGVSVGSAIPLSAFALALGANLMFGRWRRPPSQGAVDNGAGVAVVVELCRRVGSGELRRARTNVTACLFSGEEVQMQGSVHFVAARRQQGLPDRMLNLEVVGQDGDYGLWESDGTALTALPLDARMRASVEEAVVHVTGRPPRPLPMVNSDAFPFLRSGVPAVILSSLDRELGISGVHSGLDNRERVHAGKVMECVDIVAYWLKERDREVVRG